MLETVFLLETLLVFLETLLVFPQHLLESLRLFWSGPGLRHRLARDSLVGMCLDTVGVVAAVAGQGAVREVTFGTRVFGRVRMGSLTDATGNGTRLYCGTRSLIADTHLHLQCETYCVLKQAAMSETAELLLFNKYNLFIL